MNAGYINVASVITIPWRLGLRAPLVARNYISMECRLIYPSRAYKLNKAGKTRRVARCVFRLSSSNKREVPRSLAVIIYLHPLYENT